MFIFYICFFSAWNSVSRELDMCHNQPHSNSSNYRNGASVTYYQECEPNPQLKGKHFALSRSKIDIISLLYTISLI